MIHRPLSRGSPPELYKGETFAHKGRLERDALGRLGLDLRRCQKDIQPLHHIQPRQVEALRPNRQASTV